MRIALLFAIALAASGCAKKSKPAAAPAAPAATESAAPGGPSDDKPKDSADENGPKKPGDPCDGGENK